MRIRDEELKRLEKYAQGLGTKIKYKEHRLGDPGAAWVLSEDGSSEIDVYTWPQQSKTRLILNIVHELGHLLAFVYRNRKEDIKTFNAFYLEDQRKRTTDPLLPKEQRKLIYKSEMNDAKYREFIWHEVGIKIPEWKLHLDIDLDNFIYKCYYIEGNTPIDKRLERVKKAWRKKHSK